MTVEIFWLCSCLLRSSGIRLGIAEWGKTTLNSVFPLSFHMDGWMDGWATIEQGGGLHTSVRGSAVLPAEGLQRDFQGWWPYGKALAAGDVMSTGETSPAVPQLNQSHETSQQELMEVEYSQHQEIGLRG